MLTRWYVPNLPSSFTLMDQIQKQVDEMFANPTSGLFQDLMTGRFSPFEAAPRLYLKKDEHGQHLFAELPGVDAKDLKVQVEDDVLSISAVREVAAPEGYVARRSERSAYTIDKRIRLPFRVDSSKVSAELKNGVLSVSLPRRAEEAPRTIAIQTASAPAQPKQE